MPQRMAGRAMEALEDRQLLSLAQDLAVVEAMICETLEGLGETTTGNFWRQANAAYSELTAAVVSMDPETVKSALEAMGGVLKMGAHINAGERKLLELFESRRKMVDTEAKRLRELHATMDYREAMTLLGFVVAIVNKYVPDPQARAAVASEIGGLVHRGDDAGGSA